MNFCKNVVRILEMECYTFSDFFFSHEKAEACHLNAWQSYCSSFFSLQFVVVRVCLEDKLGFHQVHVVMRHEVAPFCVTCQFGLSRDILTFELEYFLK